MAALLRSTVCAATSYGLPLTLIQLACGKHFKQYATGALTTSRLADSTLHGIYADSYSLRWATAHVAARLVNSELSLLPHTPRCLHSAMQMRNPTVC